MTSCPHGCGKDWVGSSNRQAKQPLDADAVAKANTAAWANCPRLTNPDGSHRQLTLSDDDYYCRRVWMDAYLQALAHKKKPGTTPDKPKVDPTSPVVPCPKANLVVKVTDYADKPIQDAIVNVVGIGVMTTNKSGFADYGEVTPGTYLVSAEKDGYRPAPGQPLGPAATTADVPENQTTVVPLKLDELICTQVIEGPADVPGLSKYKYRIKVPGGKTISDIRWSVDKPTASFDGATNAVEAIVKFTNTQADWIKLKAVFKLDGVDECASKQVALVRVEVGAGTFTNPGKAGSSNAGTKIFLVNPPAAPAVPTWIVTHDPGSSCASFTYNGTLQAAEPRRLVSSDGGGGGSAYHAEATVTLTSPAEKPAALQKIQVGYIQGGEDSGSATYATTPAGLKRTVRTPAGVTVDWLSNPCHPGGTDEWPWYDSGSRETGTGTGTWSKSIKLSDSPGLSIPAQYNPNDGIDVNQTKAILSAAETFAFVIRMAARTLDNDLDADKHYFEESRSTWEVDFAWPAPAGVSIVTTGAAWTTPGSAKEIEVNVVPTSTKHNAPFLRWEH